MQQHYEAAERLQSSGDLAQADFQYKLFLADALHRIASGRARTGEYARAVPLFDDAIKFSPNDTAMRLDYAEAALAAGDMSKARVLAQAMLDSLPKTAQSRQIGKLHLLLGHALLGMNESKQAKEQFEAAVAIEPTFENGYALATAYLALSDSHSAAKIFAEMLTHTGDTAEVHMDFGRAYGQGDFPEEAILEFKKVLAKNDRMSGAHYSLGASYLLRSGEASFPQAEAEFRKELSIHPNDYFSYSQLGYIEMNKHNLPEAVSDLTRAATLNPQNPDNFLLLGQIYAETDHSSDAIAALRKSIAATSEPSRNHYQVRGAHYQLGRLLIQSGNVAEGKKEMQISETLLLQNRLQDEANLTGRQLVRSPFPKTAIATPAIVEAEAMTHDDEQRIGPAIADSYNNLGVIAALGEEYSAATGYFAEAAQWNPALDGLDYNWGRSAFAAKEYRQAALCLSRYLEAHPDNIAARSPLGMSLFMLGEYPGAIHALSPISSHLNDFPLLAYAYAASLVNTGDYDKGVYRLQALAKSNPGIAVIHDALGRALANHGDYQQAQSELLTAVQINPADSAGKYQLALVLIELKHEKDAEALLMQLTASESGNSDVYYQLGKLQIDSGDTNAAIANLEKAVKINPGSDPIHRQLVEAYRKASREQDAVREGERYATIQGEHATASGMGGDSSKPN